MARGRMLNAKISMNKRVAQLYDRVGPDGVLVYTWLIGHLDRDGRHHGDPDVIRSTVIPRLSGVGSDLVRITLELANELGLIIWYENDGELYLEYPKFRENQRYLKYNKEAVSEFPPSSHPGSNLVRTKCELGRELLSPKGREGKRREGKRREGKGRESLSEKSQNLTRRVEDEIPQPPSIEPTPIPSPPAPERKTSKHHESAMQVADYYRERNPGRGKAIRPGHADWKRIVALLEHGFTVDELNMAVDGNLLDDWHVEHRKHSAEFVFRNATKVEGFIDVAMNGNPAPRQEMGNLASATQELLEEFANGGSSISGIHSHDDGTPGLLPERGS